MLLVTAQQARTAATGRTDLTEYICLLLNTGNCPIINDNGNKKEVCRRQRDGKIPESGK